MKKETIIPQQIITTWECDYHGCTFSTKIEKFFNEHVEEHVLSEKIDSLPSKKVSIYVDGNKDFLYFEFEENFLSYITQKSIKWWEWVGPGWYVFSSGTDSCGDHYWSDLVPAKELISQTEDTFNSLQELVGKPTLQELQDLLILATLELSLNMNKLSLRSKTTNRVLSLLLRQTGESTDTPDFHMLCPSRIQTLLTHLESDLK